MTVEANVVHLEVVGNAIRDEIIRNQSEITHRLADLEGINCPVHIEVTVTESAAVTRPIRPEDKLSHLTERNPLLTELRRELDLEIE